MTLAEIFKNYRLEPKGIIHIGGDAAELAEYEAVGFKRILFIEPNHEKFAKIQEAVKMKPHCLGVRAAAGMDNGYCEIDGRLTPRYRLDTILVSLGIHPKHFNCIAVDGVDCIYSEDISMGFGGFEVAKYLDVICGEYVGDRFLNLWQTPAHGRFGNELFQYAFANMLCRHHHLTLHTPPWPGGVLFGLQDEFLQQQAPVIEEHDPRPEFSGLWQSLTKDDVPAPTNAAIFGNFQFHTGQYTPEDKAIFVDLFQPVIALRRALENALEAMMGAHKTLVAIHVRRGDYTDNHPGMFYRTPVASYVAWLKELWPLLEAPLLYVATDDPNVIGEFQAQGYVVFTAKDMNVPIEEQFYVDFWVMTQAGALAISNSSFSFAAAMLNEKAVSLGDREPGEFYRYARPDRAGVMHAFNPWNDDVLLGRYDAPTTGTAEQATDAILLRLLPPIDPDREGAFIEVGCGTFGWTFECLARIGFRCHAVEPCPTKELEMACHTTGTTLMRGVMGDIDGVQPLFIGRDTNLNSIIPTWWGVKTGPSGKLDDLPDPIPVASVRLGTFLKRAVINYQITCLKLDIEGAELLIVNQLCHLAPVQLPKVIIFEYGGTNRADKTGGWTPEALANTLQCLEVLRRLGYGPGVIVENRRPAKNIDLRSTPIEADALFEADAVYGNVVVQLGSPVTTSTARSDAMAQSAGTDGYGESSRQSDLVE